MQLLDGRRYLALDVLRADALRKARLPALDGLARVVVADELQVVPVRTGLEPPAEAQTPDLFNLEGGGFVVVGLRYVILR